jgi:hypothetical protein
MSKKMAQTGVGNLSKAEYYEFTIQGHIDHHWAAWFEQLTITHLDGGETRLSGPVVDQAALHGILNRIRDLGMPLLSVRREQEASPPFGVSNAASDEQRRKR